jgi:hypothetical protein
MPIEKRTRAGIAAIVGIGAAVLAIGAHRRAPRVSSVALSPAVNAAPESREPEGPGAPASGSAGDPVGAVPPRLPSLGVPLMPPRFAEMVDASTFQKGNIHTHTNWSDGDHPPKDVYLWYRSHGYAFVAITDHNTFTDPAQFLYVEKPGSFVIIPGEEVTMIGNDHQVHVNAICTRHTVGGHRADTAAEALTWAVSRVTEQGGVALVNHPNFDWALTAPDIRGARGAQLLEIASGHPWVHTEGDEAHLSHEAIWDTLLSEGESFAGVAVDDAHSYGSYPPERMRTKLARPGRAWIEVFAAAPERKAICSALAAGRLYASTGVKLQRIHVEGDTYALTLGTPGAEVEFIGQGGRSLTRVRPSIDQVASYRLRGDEGYVRARVTAPDGKRAWTQPSRLAMDPVAKGSPALLPELKLNAGPPHAPSTPVLVPPAPAR